MEKEDLVIGQSYLLKKHEITLRGFDCTGDPVFESDTINLIPYSKVNESRDPACKAGMYGVSIDVFLEFLSPVP